MLPLLTDGSRHVGAGVLLLALLLGTAAGSARPTGATALDLPAAQAVATPGVQDGEPALLDCATIGTEAAPLDSLKVAPSAVYTILSEESEARYRAQEELAGQGANEAVGTTRAFIGQVLFAADGLPLPCSRFDVDLRTLTSDEARRDNFLYTNTLETASYPLATFVLSAVEGLTEPLVEGEERTFLLIGDLSLHGVTRVIAWEATVTLEGDRITGGATTTFEMPDFEIEEPIIGPVLSVDETISLEVDIVAERTV